MFRKFTEELAEYELKVITQQRKIDSLRMSIENQAWSEERQKLNETIRKLQEDIDSSTKEKDLLFEDIRTMQTISQNIQTLMSTNKELSPNGTNISYIEYQKVKLELGDVQNEQQVFESIIKDLENHIRRQEEHHQSETAKIMNESEEMCQLLRTQLNNVSETLTQQNEKCLVLIESLKSDFESCKEELKKTKKQKE